MAGVEAGERLARQYSSDAQALIDVVRRSNEEYARQTGRPSHFTDADYDAGVRKIEGVLREMAASGQADAGEPAPVRSA